MSYFRSNNTAFDIGGSVGNTRPASRFSSLPPHDPVQNQLEPWSVLYRFLLAGLELTPTMLISRRCDEVRVCLGSG